MYSILTAHTISSGIISAPSEKMPRRNLNIKKVRTNENVRFGVFSVSVQIFFPVFFVTKSIIFVVFFVF